MGNDEKKLTGRGGPGRGQGRKKKPAEEQRVHFKIRFRPDVIRWLREQPEPVAKLVERSVLEKYGDKISAYNAELAEPSEPFETQE